MVPVMADQGAIASVRQVIITTRITIVYKQRYPFLQAGSHSLQPGGQIAVQFGAIAGCRFVFQGRKNCLNLLQDLCDANYRVSLETSGAIDVSQVDERVSRVVDIKTPDSGEAERNLWANLGVLTTHDQIKFVICSRGDYDWAVAEIRSRGLEQKLEILFSPAWGQLDATQLAEWVLQDGLNVRVQLQLHKLLWGDVPGK